MNVTRRFVLKAISAAAVSYATAPAAELVGNLPNAPLSALPPPTHPTPETFVRTLLQQVAASLGMSYDELAHDFCTASYSAGREKIHRYWIDPVRRS